MSYRFIVVFCSFVFIFTSLQAQQSVDSLVNSTREVQFSEVDTVSGKVSQTLEQLTTDLNTVNGVLKRGLDTLEIHDDLPGVSRLLDNIKTSFFGPEITPSLRGLYAAKVLLVQNEAKLDQWQQILETYNLVLQDLRKEILHGLKLGEFKDTSVLLLYKAELSELGKKWQTVNSRFETQNENIGILLQRVTRAKIINTDLLDEANFRIRNVKREMLHKTDPYLWEKMPPPEGELLKILSKPTRLAWGMFIYYILEHLFYIFLLVLVVTSFYVLTNRGLLLLKQNGRASQLEPLKYLSRNSLLCSLLFGFTIIPFVSFSPPAIYIELLWFGMLLVATRLAWPDWSPAYRKYWRGIVLMFLLFGMDNLIIRITAIERWLMLGMVGFAVYVGWRLIREVRKEPGRYPVYQNEVVWLFIMANVLAIILNIFGRFTLAKVIINSAVIGLAHALSFFLLVEIFIEALYLLLEVNDKNKFAAFFKFSEIKLRFRKILVFTGSIFWLMAFFWSLNLLDSVKDGLSEILQKQRLIGTMDFTLGSIVIFILVFWCAFALSNVLRFFFGGGAGTEIGGGRKNIMGSWILLVRLLIISIGFLLAMGAAGIPLDKLAIIIGALGVGIGFGLQNIVNNLVSGIILAFEKPMDVGDVIEIGPDSGRVKEIGIRSSKISTFDGADIIVPNGDFISHRLTNWTHNNTYRRIDIKVGVSYGTDLEMAQKVVQLVLDGDPKIESQPAPNIYWDEMGQSAVTMRILFWTTDFDNWIDLKSRVLKGVYQEFNQRGISIPFPQQDLHLRSIDREIIQQLKSGKKEE